MILIVKIGIIIGIIIAVMVVAVVALVYTTIIAIEEQLEISLSDDFDLMVLDVDHAVLVRNNAAYVGEMVMGTGQIIGIDEMTLDEQAYMIDAGEERYYLMYDRLGSDADLDYVQFRGTVAGLQEMSLASGSTVPAVVIDPKEVIFSSDSFD